MSHMEQGFQAQLAQALAVKLIEAQEAPAKVEDAPSQGTPSVVSDSEDGGSARGEGPIKTSAVQPRFLSFSELSNIDWNRLAKSQEWRTVLQLKGLPPKLCRREAVEALLEAHGLKADVQKVRTSIKPSGKFGSAVLHATSTEAVSRVCRFFHGRQFAGSRIPISVSFADGKVNRPASTQLPTKLAEPKRVNSEMFAGEGDGSWVEPPPGLENLAPRSPMYQLSSVPVYA